MNKTALYKMTYRAIEPVVHTYFSKREVVEDKGEMNEETKVMFVASFMQSLNRSFSIITQNQKEETVQVQLKTLLSTFDKDKNAKNAIEIASLRYWKNRMIINKWESSDLFNYLFLRLSNLGVLPTDEIINVRVVPSSEQEAIQGYSYTLLDEYIHDSLTGLYNSLKEQKCIAPDTDFETFYDAFSGKPISDIKKRIRWIKPKILAVYFIFRLLHVQKISNGEIVPITKKISGYKIQNDGVHWKQLELLFEDKNGKPMNNGSREFNKIGVQLLPKESEIIDDILVKGGLKGPINKW